MKSKKKKLNSSQTTTSKSNAISSNLQSSNSDETHKITLHCNKFKFLLTFTPKLTSTVTRTLRQHHKYINFSSCLSLLVFR